MSLENLTDTFYRKKNEFLTKFDPKKRIRIKKIVLKTNLEKI